jgi:DNA (cytosine-5)-methyltransferase 1
MTFGSLFSGIGGFDLGFERAGWRCAWQVEIDEFNRLVLAKHWPAVRRQEDVRRFPPAAWVQCPCCDNCLCTWHGAHAHDCPEAECPEVETWESEWGISPYFDAHPGWKVDCIIGGDPCQENSGARGYGQVSQESLGSEFLRVVDALRPRLVVRENPAHVRKDAPWPWWKFRAGLESLGYAVLPFRLRACCLGARHQRERLFLLAEHADANGERLEGWQDSCAARNEDESPRLVETAPWPNVPGRHGHCSRDGIPSYVGMVRGFGNAVVPQVAEWIGREILRAMNHEP